MRKEDRRVKVYEGTKSWNDPWYRTKYKTQPQIKLKGDWLAELGFEPGANLNVHCEQGKLIITLADEMSEKAV